MKSCRRPVETRRHRNELAGFSEVYVVVLGRHRGAALYTDMVPHARSSESLRVAPRQLQSEEARGVHTLPAFLSLSLPRAVRPFELLTSALSQRRDRPLRRPIQPVSSPQRRGNGSRTYEKASRLLSDALRPCLPSPSSSRLSSWLELSSSPMSRSRLLHRRAPMQQLPEGSGSSGPTSEPGTPRNAGLADPLRTVRCI